MMSKKKILIVDDDKTVLGAMNRFFTNRSFQPFLAMDPETAISINASEKPRLVFSDIHLPGMDGIEMLKQMKQSNRDMGAVLMTGDPARDFIIQGLKMGASDFLVKPIDWGQLNETLLTALRQIDERAKEKKQKLALENQVKEREDEVKQTQRELFQASKMSAMGELAAGLAHEINQPLTALKLTAQDALFTLDEQVNKGDIKESLKEMVSHTEMISKIINNMRQMTRASENELIERVSINQLLMDVLSLVQFQLRKRNISVEMNLTQGLQLLMSSPIKLQQVFMNVLANARDALDESGKQKKTLKIQTHEEFVKNGSPEPKKELIISIHDNAGGIPFDARKKIFMPLFTTKDKTKGTGLGLSISKKIMESLGGRIEFDTQLGQGTCFRLHLPTQKQHASEPRELEAA